MFAAQTAVISTYSFLLAAKKSMSSLFSVGFAPSDVMLLLRDSDSGHIVEITEHHLEGSVGAPVNVALRGERAVSAHSDLVTKELEVINEGGLAENFMGEMVQILIGMGIPEEEAEQIDRVIQLNGVILFVHCDTFEEILRAKNELKSAGARHISARYASPLLHEACS